MQPMTRERLQTAAYLALGGPLLQAFCIALKALRKAKRRGKQPPSYSRKRGCDEWQAGNLGGRKGTVLPRDLLSISELDGQNTVSRPFWEPETPYVCANQAFDEFSDLTRFQSVNPTEFLLPSGLAIHPPTQIDVPPLIQICDPFRGTTILDLPPEIWLEIFSWTVAFHNGKAELFRPAPNRAPLVLTHICRGLRRLAISAPELWVTICVGPSPSGYFHDYRLSLLWHERANGRPLAYL